MGNLVRVQEAEWALFLKALERCGSRAAAAREAGLLASTVAKRMERDEYFASAVHDHEAVALGRCEATLHALANGDIAKTVWHQGMPVGHEPIFSERAAMFLLERRDPRYRAKQEIGPINPEPVRTPAEKADLIMAYVQKAIERKSAQTIDVTATEKVDNSDLA